MTMPPMARWLGLAGLAPQIIAFTVVLNPQSEWRFAALAMAYFYAAVILSFLGGLWWGLAARADRAPGWVWVAAVVPSLIAFGSAWPWAAGEPWPGPSMVLLGVSLVAALGVDWRLVRDDVAPAWWLRLRVPLSLGLGGLTLAIGVVAGG